jgi:hypothetical protein
MTIELSDDEVEFLAKALDAYADHAYGESLMSGILAKGRAGQKASDGGVTELMATAKKKRDERNRLTVVMKAKLYMAQSAAIQKP